MRVTAHKNSRGGRYAAGIYSMTCHHGFGKATGASPNGRPAGFRLSNGLSPVDGADKKGPTGVLQSAALFGQLPLGQLLRPQYKVRRKPV